MKIKIELNEKDLFEVSALSNIINFIMKNYEDYVTHIEKDTNILIVELTKEE